MLAGRAGLSNPVTSCARPDLQFRAAEQHRVRHRPSRSEGSRCRLERFLHVTELLCRVGRSEGKVVSPSYLSQCNSHAQLNSFVLCRKFVALCLCYLPVISRMTAVTLRLLLLSYWTCCSLPIPDRFIAKSCPGVEACQRTNLQLSLLCWLQEPTEQWQQATARGWKCSQLHLLNPCCRYWSLSPFNCLSGKFSSSCTA